jgi:hypothetical protein
MKAFVVMDENGHLHAFNADNQKIWLGLGSEAMKRNCITTIEFADLAKLIVDKDWAAVLNFFEEKDVIHTGRSGGNAYDIVPVKEEWEEGVAQLETP